MGTLKLYMHIYIYIYIYIKFGFKKIVIKSCRMDNYNITLFAAAFIYKEV